MCWTEGDYVAFASDGLSAKKAIREACRNKYSPLT
jgi:hypothetical protein